MPRRSELPLLNNNESSADLTCGHCDGATDHEPWCITQNPSVQYAYQIITDPAHLSFEDYLILHALGAAWTAQKTRRKLRQ
jgi:hypothetical protein